MAFARGRNRFRRRSFGRRGRSGRGKSTEKNWLDRTYFQVLQPNLQLGPAGTDFIDFFALVEEPEYTNVDSLAADTRQDEGAILRCMGHVNVDVPVEAEADEEIGQTSLLWGAWLLRIGSEDLENTFVNDVADLDAWDPARRGRLDILQYFWPKYLFEVIAPGFDDVGTVWNNNRHSTLEFDVPLARKMRTDQELYLCIRGAMGVFPGETAVYSVDVQSRTLLSEK